MNSEHEISNELTILVADDHPLILDSLSYLLSSLPWVSHVYQASDGLELWIQAQKCDAAGAVVDLSMPRMDGLSSIRRLRKRFPEMAIVAMTGSENWYPAEEAYQSGADEYLTKHREGDDVVKALSRALARRGHKTLLPQGTAKPEVALPLDSLTQREREVLKLLAEGYSVRDSADILYVSPATIRKHRENLYAKLGSNNIARLTLLAVRMGVVE